MNCGFNSTFRSRFKRVSKVDHESVINWRNGDPIPIGIEYLQPFFFSHLVKEGEPAATILVRSDALLMTRIVISRGRVPNQLNAVLGRDLPPVSPIIIRCKPGEKRIECAHRDIESFFDKVYELIR